MRVTFRREKMSEELIKLLNPDTFFSFFLSLFLSLLLSLWKEVHFVLKNFRESDCFSFCLFSLPSYLSLFLSLSILFSSFFFSFSQNRDTLNNPFEKELYPGSDGRKDGEELEREEEFSSSILSNHDFDRNTICTSYSELPNDNLTFFLFLPSFSSFFLFHPYKSLQF